MTWHLITGEYPPQPGGVSDYTRLVAIELARAGDAVNVWAPGPDLPSSVELGIMVHRLPGNFGFNALRILDRALVAAPGGRLKNTQTKIASVSPPVISLSGPKSGGAKLVKKDRPGS